MINKKEHILAFKISGGLLFFAFFIVPIILYGIPKEELVGMGINKHFLNRYIIMGILSIFIYFVSYYFAKKTFEPITEANKKLREYNHNLAHELKTPLSVIKSDLELLEMGNKLDLNIIKSSKEELISMQEIIDSLLFLSQKNNSIEKTDIVLSLFIDKYLNNKYNNKLFKLELIKSKKIKISEKLFEILLKNLIDNAIKYGDNKQKILIKLDKNSLIIKNYLKNNNLKINKNKLFDNFYQSDNSRNSKGYGLGLNIAKKIIILHKFTININIKDNLFIVLIKFK